MAAIDMENILDGQKNSLFETGVLIIAAPERRFNSTQKIVSTQGLHEIHRCRTFERQLRLSRKEFFDARDEHMRSKQR
jgi:hypothetical protein